MGKGEQEPLQGPAQTQRSWEWAVGECHGVSLTLHVVQVRGAQHLGLCFVSGHLLLWATQAAQGTAWAQPLPQIIAG